MEKIEFKLPVNYNALAWQERKMVREQYVEKQKGLCHYCKKPLSGEPKELIKNIWIDEDLFPENFFNYPVHLHHSHETGKTIGVVHARCNAYLWQYKGE